MLGNIYVVGETEGVTRNVMKAVYWLEQAASQGNKDAKEMLDDLSE